MVTEKQNSGGNRILMKVGAFVILAVLVITIACANPANGGKEPQKDHFVNGLQADGTYEVRNILNKGINIKVDPAMVSIIEPLIPRFIEELPMYYELVPHEVMSVLNGKTLLIVPRGPMDGDDIKVEVRDSKTFVIYAINDMTVPFLQNSMMGVIAVARDNGITKAIQNPNTRFTPVAPIQPGLRDLNARFAATKSKTKDIKTFVLDNQIVGNAGVTVTKKS
jgi:hypothetical protein